MPAYNVYLGEVGIAGLDQATKDAVRTLLTDWFGQIVRGTDNTANVSWVSSVPAIQPHELLIYFVLDRAGSVVESLPGGPGRRLGNGDGNTAWTKSLTASEVYVARSRRFLAQIAFHEAMHNKLHLGDQALHARTGLARLPVIEGSSPSDENISQMRAGMAAKHPQWTGGWAAADPLSHM